MAPNLELALFSGSSIASVKSVNAIESLLTVDADNPIANYAPAFA